MCGICGAIDFQGKGIEAKTLRNMCRTLAYRGPDDEGLLLIRGSEQFEIKGSAPLPSGTTYFEAGLGQRRLSIIDLSEIAHQPMCNEDSTVWIVFNGEIYNFQKIRVDLERRGHRFRSKSDTEAIVHAYEEWGVDCLRLFRGMFAFAIWDMKLKRLFVARDRLGKKPLVYLNRNGCFAFASELKALLQIPGVDRKVNLNALHHYLTFQYVPSPETIFDGIFKLPPAHYLIWDSSGGLRIERYWNLHFPARKGKEMEFHDICTSVREKLEESVKLRLISDVPLGAFLSGGIDSSLVVGLMAKLSEKPVQTFSIGFEEKEFDELDYARIVAKRFSTDHHEFVVKPDAIGILPRLVWHYNEPFADSSAIPTYYVAKSTRDHVKVVLTGDAGDENFAGYPRYLRAKWVSVFSKLPERVRRDLLPPILRGIAQCHWKEKSLHRLADFVKSLSSHQARNYGEQVKIFNVQEKEDLYSSDFMRVTRGTDPMEYLVNKHREAATDDLVDQLLYVDIQTYLPEDLLVKMDIATMANSLEARAPFLDHVFMEFVATIPSRLKLKGSITKYVLKEAFSDFLPGAIFERRKMGFGVPVARWFRRELKDYVFEVLLDNRSLKRGYFRREGVEHLLKEHLSLRYDHSAKIWALLVLEIWFRIFVDQEENQVEYRV